MLYLIYETYTDEIRNTKKLRFNTKIVGAYTDKRIAKAELEKYLYKTIKDVSTEQNWFVKKFDKGIIKDELDNIVKIYEIFNNYIDNGEEVYYVILEEIKLYE